MASYELVLQFRGREVETEDEVVEIEDALVELLRDAETLDDHEIGADARNISVMTSDPQATFARVTPFLAQAALLDHVIAAFRLPPAQFYTVIWPADDTDFSRS